MNVHLTNLEQQHDAVVSLDENLFQQRVVNATNTYGSSDGKMRSNPIQAMCS